jgi:hypothetical protein
VTITGGVGCTSTATAVIAASRGINATTTSTAQIQGQSNGTAIVTPTGGTAPYIYNWSNGRNTATITGLVAGTYTVTVTDARQCSATRTAVVSIVNGTNEIDGFNNLLLYPNPVAQNLLLLGDFEQNTMLNITVTDALGRILYHNTLENIAHLNHSITFGEYSEGIYFVTLQANKGRLTRRIVHIK